MSARYVAILIVIMGAVTLYSQNSPVADAEAERILDNAAHAEGSEDALNSLQTLRVTGGIDAGLFPSNKFESITAFPQKFCDTFRVRGDILAYGYDGTEAWVQLVSGQGLTLLPRIQLMLPAVQWRLRYTKAQFVGQSRISKREAYVIRASIRGQSATADYYYDLSTYLLLGVDVVSPKAVTIRYLVSHYKETSGLKIPRQWDFGASRAVVDSIEVNIPIADKRFARPK